MRRLAALALCLFPTRTPAQALPPVVELRARAIASFARSERDRERYLCTERIQNDELDSHGAIKKQNIRERELFYVNGYAISQDISKDGQPLSESARKHRDAAVQNAIHAATAHQKPREEGLVLSAADLLRVATLTNERRTLVAGRSTILFDARSNPEAQADTVPQRLMRAMEGTVAIDEATGTIQSIDTHGIRDVTVGGGLVARIHKGFHVRVVVAPQGEEGVWLLTLAEGTGIARIGLFLLRGDHFKQETQGCKLFNVSAEAKTKQ